MQTTAGFNPGRAAIRRARAWRPLLLGIAITALHGAVALLLMGGQSGARPHEVAVLPIVANLIEPQSSSFLSLNPELESARFPVAINMPTLPVDLESSDTSLQPPILDPEMRLDVSAYSARALLPLGTVAAVILLLDIGEDGAVLSAKVVRSDAGEAAKGAAVDYALATRWIPGRVDGEPKAMQASLTVILGERT